MLAVTEMSRETTTAGACGGALVYSRMSEGKIPSPGKSCEYTFAAKAGDVITVVMTRRDNALDPAVWLLGPDRKQVQYCDDDGNDRNSRIAGQILPTSGTYTVVAGSYNSASAGPFYLTIWPH